MARAVSGPGTMSSSGSGRTSGNRFSGIFLVAQTDQKFSRGMIFRVADDCHADSEESGEIPFGDGVWCVVGAFSMYVGLKLAQQRVDIEFVENYDVIHRREGRNERGARAFRQNRTACALQRSRARVGI